MSNLQASFTLHRRMANTATMALVWIAMGAPPDYTGTDTGTGVSYSFHYLDIARILDDFHACLKHIIDEIFTAF